MTLRQALLEQRNSLNLIRLILAASVIVGHAWPVGRQGQPPDWLQATVSLAVPGFFCLSGFLIAHSRMRLGFGRYLWNRCLRIMPGYWVVLGVVAVVAAPLSPTGGGSWNAAAAVDYVLSNSALRQFEWNIPGTVDGRAWNGSLWTLWFEFVAYLGAGVLLSIGPARRRAAVTTVALYLVGAVTVWWVTGPGATQVDLVVELARLGTYFLAGMSLYFLADRVRMDGRLALGAAACVVLLLQLGWMQVAGGIALAYVLLWTGGRIPARWAQRHDISYGVYIYAYPVQVLLEWFAPALGVVSHVVLATALTVPLAWASWLLVERPAMRLKDFPVRSPRRGVPVPPVSPAAPRTTAGL